jgi:glycerol-3-phosphate acyltransferase PlsY
MIEVWVIALFITSYAWGSLPTGKLFQRLPSIWLRFLFSMVKGAVPLVCCLSISRSFGFPDWIAEVGAPNLMTLKWWVLFFTLLGHCFSPFLRFRAAGKGLFTAFGGLLLISPLGAGVGVLTFVIAYSWNHGAWRALLGQSTQATQQDLIAIARISGLLAANTAVLVLEQVGYSIWPMALIALIVLIRHEEEIDHLLDSSSRSVEH